MELDRMTRPRIALIATTYFKPAHADVIGTRLIEGYPWNGEEIESRVEIAGMYLEQIDPSDIGLEIARRNDVPLFGSVAECMALGGTGVQVDGVVIVGEHGEYGRNELGQTLYPRRRLFDSAVSAMIGAGTFVPVFSDKHLAWSTADAEAMYDLARRHDIPLLACSSVPLAWRVPQGTDWPLGEPIESVVAVSYGPTESYGFHVLEAMQVIAERRPGGETGVLSVQALSGDEAKAAIADGRVDAALFAAAMASFGLPAADETAARQTVRDVFLVTYRDGTRGAAVLCEEGVRGFAVAASGPTTTMACEMHLEPSPYRHFVFLVRAIERLIIDREEPWPVERTLLTTCMLDAAMHSRHANGKPVETPGLATLTYQAPASVPDTGHDREVPTPLAEREF
jgi:hypothetical protein